MKKIKLLSVYGTRPDAAKMCPLVRHFEKYHEFESLVCVTGQHREMLDQMNDLFGVTPDFDLNIMQKSQSLTDIFVRALPLVGEVVEKTAPDLVLVHGDTSTAFAAALAAFYAKVPVAHVEAGLRSFDKYSPHPEEMNRVLVDHISEIFFAPTEENAHNLRNEGILRNIFVTGNTVIDGMAHTVKPGYLFKNEALRGVDFSKKVVTLTAHRRENYGEPMESIFSAVRELALEPDVRVVYPVHLSPAVRQTAQKMLGNCKNILLIDPLDLADLHNLMANSLFIMTDSGGLQEEAPALGKPVLVLRRETERPEAVRAGTVKVAGVEKDSILKSGLQLLAGGQAYAAMANAVNPYGDGRACERIAQNILFHFGVRERPATPFAAVPPPRGQGV